MNKQKLLTILIIFSLCIMTGCNNNSNHGVDLDRVLRIMSTTLSNVEYKSSQYPEGEIMAVFAKQFQTDINNANPKIHPQTIGVLANNDGSISGFNDKNSNNTKDSGERQLFKVEIDATNQRLLASEGNQVRESRHAGTGLLTGLLIGSMLSRQRTAGVTPSSLSSKKTTPKSSTRKTTTSARSRSGSGSYSRGK